MSDTDPSATARHNVPGGTGLAGFTPKLCDTTTPKRKIREKSRKRDSDMCAVSADQRTSDLGFADEHGPQLRCIYLW